MDLDELRSRELRHQLFVSGDFTLHSGAKSKWKIECDALIPEGWPPGVPTPQWEAIARMAMEVIIRPLGWEFSEVAGVPRGGIPFADALRLYVVKKGVRLVVDDVWTTGNSLRQVMATFGPHNTRGLVAFARRPVRTINVEALFTMPSFS